MAALRAGPASSACLLVRIYFRVPCPGVLLGARVSLPAEVSLTLPEIETACQRGSLCGACRVCALCGARCGWCFWSRCGAMEACVCVVHRSAATAGVAAVDSGSQRVEDGPTHLGSNWQFGTGCRGAGKPQRAQASKPGDSAAQSGVGRGRSWVGAEPVGTDSMGRVAPGDGNGVEVVRREEFAGTAERARGPWVGDGRMAAAAVGNPMTETKCCVACGGLLERRESGVPFFPGS